MESLPSLPTFIQAGLLHKKVYTKNSLTKRLDEVFRFL